MGGEIALKVLDHLHRLTENGLVGAPLKEDGLSPEHLGHLGEDGGAPQGDEPVGETAHGGVGGNAGQAVGAAALHTHHQLRGADVLPPEGGGVPGQLAEQGSAGGNLILFLLTDQKLYPFAVPLPQFLLELVHGQVLTAQAQHQHAPGVGVADQGGQQLSGLGVVVPHLGAAEGVGEGVQPLRVPRDQVLVLSDQLLGDVIDAAHCGDDPKLVADARPAVRAAETPEGPGGHLGQIVGLVAVSVFPVLGQAGAHIVDVDPLPRGDIIQKDPKTAHVLMEAHLNRYKIDTAAIRAAYPQYFK